MLLFVLVTRQCLAFDDAMCVNLLCVGDAASMSMLRGVLAPLLLRRTKDELEGAGVIGGKGSLDLPPRRCETLLLNLTVEERDVYRALLQRSRTKFGEYVQEGRVLNNYASILEMLLRLRQCCAHPFLVLSRGDTGGGDFDTLAQKLAPGMIAFGGSKHAHSPEGQRHYFSIIVSPCIVIRPTTWCAPPNSVLNGAICRRRCHG
jgi:hypothetical protein